MRVVALTHDTLLSDHRSAAKTLRRVWELRIIGQLCKILWHIT